MPDLDIPAVRRQLENLQIQMQADAMATGMASQEYGSYFIEDASWADFGSPKTFLLNRLLHILLEKFPNMQFAQYESLRPSERGILIEWSPRYKTHITDKPAGYPEVEAVPVVATEFKDPSEFGE